MTSACGLGEGRIGGKRDWSGRQGEWDAAPPLVGAQEILAQWAEVL